jgi:hypothetical protein
VVFATFNGLTLCLRDHILKNPGKLKNFSSHQTYLPLISNLIFKPTRESFHERYLATLRLLLKNGYSIKRDPDPPRLLKVMWKIQTGENSGSDKVLITILQELVKTALEHGQDPNVSINIFSAFNLKECKPLHTASPTLFIQLVEHDAPLNAPDSKGRTPLDWVIEPPFELENTQNWNLARRYEMCTILVKAGDTTVDAAVTAWHNALLKFDREGCDTQMLREKYETQMSIGKKTEQENTDQKNVDLFGELIERDISRM